MNKDNVKRKWKQVEGDIKPKRGESTDDEVDQIDRSFDKMVGKLQEKYGHGKGRAGREVKIGYEKYNG